MSRRRLGGASTSETRPKMTNRFRDGYFSYTLWTGPTKLS